MNKVLFYSSLRDYGWLSNFYKSVQVVNNVTYWTNEHYYQSEKTNNAQLKQWIINAPTAYAAMLAGRVCLRGKDFISNWEEIKFDIMLKGLRAKFNQNPYLKQKLLETGDLPLHEDSPTDMIWGIKGQDKLGQLIMQVRSEIRKEEGE